MSPTARSHPAANDPVVSRCARKNLDEHELGELRRHETGTRQVRCPLSNELVEKPLQDRSLGRSDSNVDQRRQDIRQQPSAHRVQQNMAADDKAIVAVAKLRDQAGVGGEHSFRVNRDGRQITGENDGTSRRKEKHVSRFNTHGRHLAVDAEPATTLHYADEFHLIRYRKADRPLTSGREAARYDGLSLRDLEDVGERIIGHIRTIAHVNGIFKPSQSDWTGSSRSRRSSRSCHAHRSSSHRVRLARRVDGRRDHPRLAI